MAQQNSQVTIKFIADTSAAKTGVDSLKTGLKTVGDTAQKAGDQLGSIRNSGASITALAQSLGTNYKSAAQFASSLGLTADQANTAVTALQNLDRVGATTAEKFRVLSREVGVSRSQFEQLNAASGVGFFNKLAAEIDKAAVSTIALQQASAQLGQAGQQINNLAASARTAAVAFDTAVAKVSTLSDDAQAVGVAMQQLQKDLDNQVNATELATAAYDVLSSGAKNAADTASVLSASTKGAIGGFSSVGTVADATTSVLNAYGLSFDQAGKVVDTFIATQNAGKIVVDQYAQQIGKVAPLAAQAGISLNELNGFIATATIKGVQAEPAFSGLRAAIAAVLKPSEEAKQLASELGVAFDAQALKTKGLSGILGELNAKGKDTPEVLTQLFGSIEAVTAIAPATGAGFKDLGKNIEASANSAGAAETAFNKVSASLEGRQKAALNEINAALVSLGQGVVAAVTPLLEAVATLVSGFNQLPDPVKQATGVLIAATGGALTLAGALVGLAAIAPILSAGFTVLATTMGISTTGLGAATIAARVFGTTIVTVAPYLGLLALAVAGIQFAKFANDTREANEQLDLMAANTGVSGNEFGALGGKLKSLNDLLKQNGSLTAEQKKQAEALIVVTQSKIKSLEEELKQAQAIVPATDEQRTAQTALVAGIQSQINALKAQSTTLSGGIAGKKTDTAATKEQTKALEEQIKAIDDASKVKVTTAATDEQKAATETANLLADGVIDKEEAESRKLQATQDRIASELQAERDRLTALEALQPKGAKEEKAKVEAVASANQKIAQLEAQSAQARADAREKAEKVALDKITKANADAEAKIKASQDARIASVKEQQLAALKAGGASAEQIERQSAAKIAQIQQESIAAEVTAKRAAIAQIQAAEAAGEIGKTESVNQQKKLQEELGQLNLKRIEAEIAAVQRAKEERLKAIDEEAKKFEDASNRKKQALELERTALSQQNDLLQAQQGLQSAIADFVVQKADFALQFAQSEFEANKTQQNALAVAQAQEQLFQAQIGALALQFDQKQKNLEITQRQKQAELELAQIQAQIATKKAEADVSRAQASGADAETLSNLQQVVNLQKQAEGLTQRAISNQQEINALNEDQLVIERTAAFNRAQNQQALQQRQTDRSLASSLASEQADRRKQAGGIELDGETQKRLQKAAEENERANLQSARATSEAAKGTGAYVDSFDRGVNQQLAALERLGGAAEAAASALGSVGPATNSLASQAGNVVQLPARRMGGPVQGGKAYQVNEAGVEAYQSKGKTYILGGAASGQSAQVFVPPSNGRIIPHGQTQRLIERVTTNNSRVVQLRSSSGGDDTLIREVRALRRTIEQRKPEIVVPVTFEGDRGMQAYEKFMRLQRTLQRAQV